MGPFRGQHSPPLCPGEPVASAPFGTVGNMPFQFPRPLSRERERLECSLPVPLPSHLGAGCTWPWSPAPSLWAERCPGPQCRHLPWPAAWLPVSTCFFLVPRSYFITIHLSPPWAKTGKLRGAEGDGRQQGLRTRAIPPPPRRGHSHALSILGFHLHSPTTQPPALGYVSTVFLCFLCLQTRAPTALPTSQNETTLNQRK